MKTEIYFDGVREFTFTHYFNDEVLENAEQELIEFFKTSGIQRPSDLEDHFCGRPEFIEMILSPMGRWRESHFFPAFNRLIHNKVIVWGVDDDGYWYKINEGS